MKVGSKSSCNKSGCSQVAVVARSAANLSVRGSVAKASDMNQYSSGYVWFGACGMPRAA